MNKKTLLTLGSGISLYYFNDRKNIMNNFFQKNDYIQNIKTKFYSWGNGIYQAKPDNTISFDNFYPKIIKNLSNNIIEVEFGKYLDAGIDKNKNLLIWDKKEISSCKVDQKDDNNIQNLKIIKNLGNVKQLKFTDNFLWVLNEKGSLFQFKIITENLKSFLSDKREIKTINNIKKISTNERTIIMLKNDGKVFSMGDDTKGQCGIAKNGRSEGGPYFEEKITNPTQIKILENIIDIESGKEHTIALSKYNDLYGWGSNKRAQLNHFTEFSKKDNPLLCTFEPIKLNQGIDNINIEKIAAGDEFTIIIGENRDLKEKEVYGFGKNINGQLGNTFINHISPLYKMDPLSNFTIRDKIKNETRNVSVDQIQCGKNHCICLLSEGYVLTWGSNKYGQLGNKKRSFKEIPLLVKKFKNKEIVKVFASHNSSGVIIKDEDNN